MALAKFLQVSDFHLGRPLGWLPPEHRDERRREQRRALDQLVSEAISRGVHAILIPGDLFDAEGVDADTLNFAIAAFRATGCPPTFIAPGNHDPYSETSLTWEPRLLRARGLAWPEHVHVFTTAHWSARPVPGLKGVRVWGRCFTSNVPSLERPLAPEALRDVSGTEARGFDIALFHGSREGSCPPGQKMTAPFSDTEATQSPFAYLAVGHYHAATRLTASAGASAGVRLAYAGSAVALDTGETGAHGALEVHIEYERRMPFVEIEFVELDRRKVWDLVVDVSGCPSAEKVDARIRKALDDAGVSDQDIVTIRLAGRLARGVRLGGVGGDLASRAYVLKLDPRRVRPDYDLDGYRRQDPTTTEERFARTLLEQLDHESDPIQRALIESALYYGLDAFRLKEVTPAYEELESEARG
ncbi:MAG: exonuclease SbcCD subunit D [Candidatus Eisenbacteria bacterium]